jgi:hypothetical protein
MVLRVLAMGVGVPVMGKGPSRVASRESELIWLEPSWRQVSLCLHQRLAMVDNRWFKPLIPSSGLSSNHVNSLA